MELYVGMDVSLKETSICVVDDNGEIVSEGTVISPLAEAVEEVGNTKFYATIGLKYRGSSYNESISPHILSHCFNICSRPDFFDSLSH